MQKKKEAAGDATINFTVLGVVSVIAILSLVLLFSASFRAAGKLSMPSKYSPGEVVQIAECNIPKSYEDLKEWMTRHTKVHRIAPYCPFAVQDYCIEENSGRCLQECLAAQRGPEGVCRTATSPLTAQVILNFEECRRLAESFAQTSASALKTVGAVPKTDTAFNPCSSSTENSRTALYSLSEPVQAYTSNTFESGDITGLYANEQKGVDGLEYTICSDGRAQVIVAGDERCSSME